MICIFFCEWYYFFEKIIFWTKSPKKKRSSRRNSISVTGYNIDRSEAPKSGTNRGWIHTNGTCYEVYNLHTNFYGVDLDRDLFVFKESNRLFKPLRSTVLKIPSYDWGLNILRIKERDSICIFPLQRSLLWRGIRDLSIYNMIKGFEQQRPFTLFCSVAELIIPLPVYMEKLYFLHLKIRWTCGGFGQGDVSRRDRCRLHVDAKEPVCSSRQY